MTRSSTTDDDRGSSPADNGSCLRFVCLFVFLFISFFLGGGSFFSKVFLFFLTEGQLSGNCSTADDGGSSTARNGSRPQGSAALVDCCQLVLQGLVSGKRIWSWTQIVDCHTCRPHGYPVRWFGLCRLRQHPRQCSLARANAEIRRFSLISLFCSSIPVSHHGWSHSWGRSSLQAHRGRCWRAWRSGPRCCTPPSRAPAAEASYNLVFASYRTLVKWNWRGSSVDKDTLRPLKLN